MLKFTNLKLICGPINQKGECLIFTLFTIYQELQSKIVERLLDEILVSNKTIFVNLLHSCCAFSKMALHACISHVQSTLQCLLSFDIDRAKTFISFMMPFIKINDGMKDAFMLILRQSMLSKNSDEQYVAILGYMMLLKNFRTVCGKIDMSQCTQFASDSYGLTQKLRQYTSSEVPSLWNEMICIEIFEYLKRCLCLHDSAKIFIYRGLKEVVSYNNQLIEPVYLFS
ncbi:hypothetical protein MXB_4484 [Myxobolus squamalis]|nr:hypothetical protein MXB_4484 [Myxobolus squamalis]